MIDLHLHTTVSDGRCTPAELVARTAEAGLRTIAVTDHDTVGATAEVQAHCAALGIRAVPGIEITAVEASRDVHVLGYFFNPEDVALQAFLLRQREARVERVREIAARLAALNRAVDTTEMLAAAKADTGKSLGRPLIARALMAAGHARSMQEAFDRWLGEGQPAFVPRTGATVRAVAAVVHAARGLVSLAHPVQLRDDALVDRLCGEGLDALEVYHADHGPADRARYGALASSRALLATGGSDYHGEPGQRASLGSVTLPAEAWEALVVASQGTHGG